jgi:hypothetical protein
MVGHIDDLGVEPFSLSDVARDGDDAGGVANHDMADRYLGPEQATVLFLAFPFENLGFALQCPYEIFDRDVLGVGMHTAGERFNRAANQFDPAVPEHDVAGPVDFREPACRRIDDEDAVVDAVKNGAEAVIGITYAGKVDLSDSAP